MEERPVVPRRRPSALADPSASPARDSVSGRDDRTTSEVGAAVTLERHPSLQPSPRSVGTDILDRFVASSMTLPSGSEGDSLSQSVSTVDSGQVTEPSLPLKPKRRSPSRFNSRPWVATHPVQPILPLLLKLFVILAQNGVQWYLRVIRLMLFVTALLPGFLHVAYYYMTSPDIVRNVCYGPNPRNNLDIYLPTDDSSGRDVSSDASMPTKPRRPQRPVIVFISGGVWTIGYKAWGAFFGRILASQGVVTVMPDYRNFPQGRVQHMMQDVDAALSWVHNNIAAYGGNPANMHLMGQSAGAHLSIMVLLFKAREEVDLEHREHSQGGTEPATPLSPHSAPAPPLVPARTADHARASLMSPRLSVDLPEVSLSPYFSFVERHMAPEWRPYQLSHIRSALLVSGPYDLESLIPHFDARGFHQPILEAIMGGLEALHQVSPIRIVQKPEYKDTDVTQRMPPIFLFHGTVDLSVPPAIAQEFQEVLVRCGYRAQLKLYPGKSHTDPIIEDLLYAEEIGHTDSYGDGNPPCATAAVEVDPPSIHRWLRRFFQLVSDDLMTDILMAVHNGRLTVDAGASSLPRRYSRPSFLAPDAPLLSPRPRGKLATADEVSPLSRRGSLLPTPWTWQGDRKQGRSALPKTFVTFARWVNPF